MFLDRLFVLMLIYFNYGKTLQKIGLKTNKIFACAAAMCERFFGHAHYLTLKLMQKAEETKTENGDSLAFTVKNQKSVLEQH